MRSHPVYQACGRILSMIRVSGRRRRERSLGKVWLGESSAWATSSAVCEVAMAGRALWGNPCWSPGSPSSYSSYCWTPDITWHYHTVTLTPPRLSPQYSPCSCCWAGARGGCPSSGWWRGGCRPWCWREEGGGWTHCDAALPSQHQSGCRSGGSWRVPVAEPRGGAQGKRSRHSSSFSWRRPSGWGWWWRTAPCWGPGRPGRHEVWYVLDWGGSP